MGLYYRSIMIARFLLKTVQESDEVVTNTIYIDAAKAHQIGDGILVGRLYVKILSRQYLQSLKG